VANEALRKALTDARMNADDLAATIGVDPKTVARWLADEGRTPHPRHRWQAADALGVEEGVLWPEIVRAALKTGHDREVVAVYPYRSSVPKTLWRDLIARAERRLDFAGFTNYFLWLEQPGLRATLHRKAEAGAAIRWLIGDPNSDITTQREQIESVPLTVSTRIKVSLDELTKLHQDSPQVQARFSDKHISMSVWIFDDDMLVSTHLADLLGHDSPTLHLRRRAPDGLYDRYASHVAYLWDNARDVWT
jgi:transcriptional regulator with XRE-family HTH domain